MTKPNIHGSKITLCSCCSWPLSQAWWNQKIPLSKGLKNKPLQYNEGYKLFCSMTILDSMLRKESRPTWKRWNEKPYSTRRFPHTLLSLNITCLDQWSLQRMTAQTFGENSSQRYTIFWIINVYPVFFSMKRRNSEIKRQELSYAPDIYTKTNLFKMFGELFKLKFINKREIFKHP